MNNRKNKKKGMKLLIGIVVIAVVGIVGYGYINGSKEAYTTYKLEKRDIVNYNSFSGNIEATNRKSMFTEGVIQIETIHVAEGDTVEVDGLLFTTTDGKEILSEIKGEVVNLYIEENAQLIPGTKLIDIVDYETLKTTIKIDEYDVSDIQIGDAMTIEVQALGKEISGVVSQVSKEAISANGISFFTATVDLDYDAALKVGMTVEAKFLKESVSGANTLPMETLKFTDENKPYVTILDENSEKINAEVTVGINDGFYVQILDGIAEDEAVIGETTSVRNGDPFANMRSMREAGEGEND